MPFLPDPTPPGAYHYDGIGIGNGHRHRHTKSFDVRNSQGPDARDTFLTNAPNGGPRRVRSNSYSYSHSSHALFRPVPHAYAYDDRVDVGGQVHGNGYHHHKHQQHQHQHHQAAPQSRRSRSSHLPLHQNVPVLPQPSDRRPGQDTWAIGSTDGGPALRRLIHRLERQRHSPVSISGSADAGGGRSVKHFPTTTTGNAGVHAPGLAIGEVEDIEASKAAVQAGKSLYHEQIFQSPPSSVEAALAASCEICGFDIVEQWIKIGPKSHQLVNSHLKPTSLDNSVRDSIVDVYYGENSNELTHRLSPALCKRAKEAKDVVWVTSLTSDGAEALRCSISNVGCAVAVPVRHDATNTNMTFIYFKIRRMTMSPPTVEFLVHMSLSAAIASVGSLAGEVQIDHDRVAEKNLDEPEPAPILKSPRPRDLYTEPRLDIQWNQLSNVEYLTDGGSSWIHSAVLKNKPVVVKTLKPESCDSVRAIDEIENELVIHSKLNDPNIVNLIGAGVTSKGHRFLVLERLDGGTLTQRLGYDTRIRDRRRRFWKQKRMSYAEVLRCARAIASAMKHLHEDAAPGSAVIHRDLKPDNLGFTLGGTLKIMDFGLSRIIEKNSDETGLEMLGKVGTLRYMAPEVADELPYNEKADVYSFGMILWELNAAKKPYEGLSREQFYERVVHGGDRPTLNEKWPSELRNIIRECWSDDIKQRPSFKAIIDRIDALIRKEKGGARKKALRKISTWLVHSSS